MAKILDILNNGSLLDRASGYDGIFTPGASKGFVQSRKGLALDFDGANTKIDTGSDWIGTKAITVSAWIYAEGWGGSNVGIIISNNKFLFNVIQTNARLGVSSDASTFAYSANNSISLNTWYHVLVTRTSTGVTNIYINGVLSGTANQSSGTPVISVNNVTIGEVPATFDGLIRNVKVWDIVLTESERNADDEEYLRAGISKRPTRFYSFPDYMIGGIS